MKSLNGAAVVAAWGALAAGGAAHAQEAVQWRVEDGGNGHWYVASREAPSLNWQMALGAATARGGHLPYVRNDAQNTLLLELFLPLLGDKEFGPALGARRLTADTPTICPDWRWLDGSPFDYLPELLPDATENGYGEDCQSTCECLNEFYPGEQYLQYWIGRFPVWNSASLSTPSPVLLIEYSGDCNDDGIVDYGQILDGTYADTNGNGVPDCCDEGVDCDPCVGDVNFDGLVNGADISVLLGFWGLNGKPVAADINNDGQVDGADLAQMLGSWGECP